MDFSYGTTRFRFVHINVIGCTAHIIPRQHTFIRELDVPFGFAAGKSLCRKCCQRTERYNGKHHYEYEQNRQEL